MKPYTLFKRRGDDRESAIWYVLVRDQGRRKAYSTGCTRKEEAEEYAELHYGSGKKAPTLRAFVEEHKFFQPGLCRWLLRKGAAGHEITENTLRVYRAALDRILGAFGEKRLTEIRLYDLEGWILRLECAHSTKNGIIGVARILFNEAQREEVLKDNPTDKLEAVRVRSAQRGVFTMEELARLFPVDAAELRRIWKSDLVATFFITIASTGLRNAEARALQWRHYLREERALHVQQQYQNGRITNTKGKHDRIIPIPSRTCMQLDYWQSSTLSSNPEDFVFPNPQGSPYGARAAQDWLRGALSNAEIEAHGRILVPHSFRHTYVTHVRRQIPAEALGEMIGHASQETTKGYDHPDIRTRIAALNGARDGISHLLPA